MDQLWHPDDHDVEALAARTVGFTLSGVRYWDTPCFEDPVDEWPVDGAHRVGHGVDLFIGDRVLAVTWGHDELALMPISLVDHLLVGRFETVHEKEPWASLIGRPVEDARVHRLEGTTGEVRRRFPFALELQFGDAGFVVLAAASWPTPDAPAWPGGHDIVVAWHMAHVRSVLPDLTEMLGFN